jgi:hypothetical protein
MPRQNDKTPCHHTGCGGTMTYHELIHTDPSADPPVRPSGIVRGLPDPDYSGWLCDKDPQHVFWDHPKERGDYKFGKPN